MRFLKRHKGRLGIVMMVCLLSLSLIPAGCGGNSSAEPSSPPKTNYELEDMIANVKDAVKVIQDDIATLTKKVKNINSTNYDKDIEDLQDQIDDLMELLITPMPQVTSSPTAQPSSEPPASSGLTATIDPDDKFFESLNAEIVIRNNTGDDVINPEVEIRFSTNSNVPIEELEAMITELDGDDITDSANYYTSSEGAIVLYAVEMDCYIPTGGKCTASIAFGGVVDEYWWTPSISVE